MRPWLKSALVALAGGALTGGLAALIDPSHFNLKDGIDEEHIAEMAVEGAAVALGGLFMRSPFGHKVMDFVKHSQEEMAANRAAIQQAQTQLNPTKKGEPDREN